MAKAIWKGQVIAESDQVETVEGNLYFPPNSIKEAFFQASAHTSVCGWKGTANYYDVVVDEEVNPNAAWVYKTPKEEAANIKGYIAFWHGVEVQP